VFKTFVYSNGFNAENAIGCSMSISLYSQRGRSRNDRTFALDRIVKSGSKTRI